MQEIRICKTSVLLETVSVVSVYKFMSYLVDGAGVMVDASFPLVAVPVLAQPVHVQVERLGWRPPPLDNRPNKISGKF